MPDCRCGSGQPRRALNDARGIFCGYVCDRCERAKRSAFDPAIFADASYPADDLGDDDPLDDQQERSK